MKPSFTDVMAAAIAVAAIGCTGNEQSVYGDIPPAGWSYGQPVVLVTDSTAMPAHARMTVALMHNDDYPYRNLWLEVSWMGADSVSVSDTVSIELCDRYGRWYGKGFGASYQVEAPLNQIQTPVPGSRVTVRHIMRVDTLHGIEKVGVDIKPAD